MIHSDAPGLEVPAQTPTGARAFPFPPALYAVPLAAGIFLDRVRPLPVPGRPASALFGGVLVAAGAALAGSAVALFVRSRTTLNPTAAVARFATGGPFRLTRNPMYAGLALVYPGVALIAGTIWPLLLLPIILAAVQHLAIEPEERYLESRFGDDYADYVSRVRRWL